MNVEELIKKLQKLPADAQVMVQGYEDGYDAVYAVKEIPVIENLKAQEWNGEYEKAEKNDKSAISAVVILGNRR